MRQTTTRVRRIAVLAASTLALATLAGCSTSSTTDCGVQAGDASSTVEATGAFDTPPTVEIPTPLVVDSAQKSVLIAGDAEGLRFGQPVVVEATVLDGTTGQLVGQTQYTQDGGSLLTVGSDDLGSLGSALECATIGSRIAVVTPPDTPGAAASGSGSVVYVIDILSAYASRATGADRLPESGMPAVVTTPTGIPGVTVPNEPAPTDYREAVLKAGDGPKVSEDATVIVKLTAVDWDTGSVTSDPASSWLSGSATVLRLVDDAATLGGGLVQSIAGQRVGSQVLAVVPPGLGPSGGGATLIYVVDILGTVG